MEKHNELSIKTEYSVRGFYNPGNACFVNVAVQVLRAIGPLVQIVERGENGRFLDSLREVIGSKNGRLIENRTRFWSAVELYLGYSPRAIRQNCACEFLRFFLVNLDEELGDRYSRSMPEDSEWVEVSSRNINQSFNFRARGKSILYDIIGMTFKSEARAKGQSSMTYQEELVISVQIENSLTESLDKYFSEGVIEEYSINGVPTRCKTRTFISAFSPYLLFHIQRFRVENGRVFKVKKFVSYPKELRIPNKYLTPSLGLAVKNGSCLIPEYEVVGIVEHHGENANSGHYTCVVKSGNGWVNVDDQVVRPVNQEFVRNRSAYILLYRQVNRTCL